MTTREIVVIGAGGHAKVIVDLLVTRGEFRVLGCLGGGATSVLGLPVIGTDEDLDRLYKKGIRYIALGVGDNRRRLQIGRSLLEYGFDAPPLIHPSAVVSRYADIAKGSVIMAGSVINAAAELGEFCIVNSLTCVEHDCHLGDGVHLAPRVSLAGGVAVGVRSLIGVGSCAIPSVRIGKDSILGAGSVVVRDIPDNVVASGVPARVRRMLHVAEV